MNIKLVKVFVLIAVVCGSFIVAEGCACCADEGMYAISTSRPTSYELDLFKEMRFGSATELFMTDAGDDAIKGIYRAKTNADPENADPDDWQMTVRAGLTGRDWHFTFTSKSNQSGTLVLPIPLQRLSFKADIHDNSDKGLGPILYKEFRFKGNVGSGSGIFKAGIDTATNYFLVFQGRGNVCDNVSDFTHWRLEVTGRKANYAFFGEMKVDDLASAKIGRQDR